MFQIWWEGVMWTFMLHQLFLQPCQGSGEISCCNIVHHQDCRLIILALRLFSYRARLLDCMLNAVCWSCRDELGFPGKQNIAWQRPLLLNLYIKLFDNKHVFTSDSRHHGFSQIPIPTYMLTFDPCNYNNCALRTIQKGFQIMTHHTSR